MNKTLISAILIIAAVVMVGAVSLPKYKDLKVEMARAQIKAQDLADRQAYYNDLIKIDAQAQQYADEISKIDLAIPVLFTEPSTFYYFQKEIQDSGMIIKNLGAITTSPSLDYPALIAHTMNLQVSGPYPVLKSFLATLQDSARMIQIEKLSFSSPAKKDSSFVANISVKFYSY